jgi:hypothetical protein
MKWDESLRCKSNTPRIPGISINQAVQELTGTIKDVIDTGFTRSTCGVSEWRPYVHPGNRQKASPD